MLGKIENAMIESRFNPFNTGTTSVRQSQNVLLSSNNSLPFRISLVCLGPLESVQQGKVELHQGSLDYKSVRSDDLAGPKRGQSHFKERHAAACFASERCRCSIHALSHHTTRQCMDSESQDECSIGGLLEWPKWVGLGSCPPVFP